MKTTSKALVIAAAFYVVIVRAVIAPGMQSPSAAANAGGPTFDVASVKANNSSTEASEISGAIPGRFLASNTALRFIILCAYQLLDHQLVGAPDWTSSAAFDVTATYSPASALDGPSVRLMVRKLLSDRFGMTAHREQRELPAYAMTLVRKDGRLGPQMRRSEIDCEQWIANKRPQNDAGGPSTVAPSGKRPACMMLATRRFLTGGTRTMEQLAAALQSMVGRPVVDRTGLTGAFDIDLQWAAT